MDLGFAGAAAVVSGGSKGMGRAAALSLAAEGARVAVLARGRSALDDTVAALQRAGSPDAIAIKTDLTVRTDVDAAFAQLAERWGECNVLVNAAGPVEVGVRRFENLDDEEWHATFDIGTLSAARCVRAALPLLRAGAAETTRSGLARATSWPETRRTGAPPSTGILNNPDPCTSAPAATIHAPSGDQSALPWPPELCMVMDGANVRAFVPSLDMIDSRSFPSCPMMMATRVPSGDTAAGSDNESPAAFQTSDGLPSWNRQRPSPAP
jgi:hypothetical protein